MDPVANVEEQERIMASETPDCERLADLILALDEWFANGGFCPRTPGAMRVLRSDAVKFLRKRNAAHLIDADCRGHESDDMNGPMGQTVYCDGTCRNA